MNTIFKSLLKVSAKTLLSSFMISIIAISPAYADGHAKHTETKTNTENDSFNLSEMTCWDVMTLPEAERGTVLFLYYGYVSGAKKELNHSGASIAKILTQLGDHCAENPDDELLALMMKG